jgi:hypothetical protein
VALIRGPPLPRYSNKAPAFLPGKRLLRIAGQFPKSRWTLLEGEQRAHQAAAQALRFNVKKQL